VSSTCALASTYRQAHEPQNEKNDRCDPQEVKGEPQSREQQYKEKYQKNDHLFPSF
jgi:hypothetical protein